MLGCLFQEEQDALNSPLVATGRVAWRREDLEGDVGRGLWKHLGLAVRCGRIIGPLYRGADCGANHQAQCLAVGVSMGAARGHAGTTETKKVSHSRGG